MTEGLELYDDIAGLREVCVTCVCVVVCMHMCMYMYTYACLICGCAGMHMCVCLVACVCYVVVWACTCAIVCVCVCMCCVKVSSEALLVAHLCILHGSQCDAYKCIHHHACSASLVCLYTDAYT